MTGQRGDVARIKRHPDDRDLVVIDVPPALNELMAQLPHARLAVEHHGYLMHNSAIPGLYRWARHHDIHVTDERATTRDRPRTRPVECANCAQPGRLYDQPTRCPACGEPWKPVTPPDAATAVLTRTTCTHCGNAQAGRFPFCADCGEPMVHPTPNSPLVPQQPRERLDEPLPLSDTIEEAMGTR